MLLLQNCMLFNLPDLNQENHYVTSTLLRWIYDLTKDYHIDGIRIDTVPYVPHWFWDKFARASGVYTIGEVADPRYDYVAGYQKELDGLLNYPMYFVLNSIFGNGTSMLGFRGSSESLSRNITLFI